MCNMHCDYCFYCDEAQKRLQKSYGFMSDETLKNVIRKTILRAEGVISYAFQGGEPTLRGLDFFKKAVAYEKQYNRNHIKVQNAFQTNGYLLDDEWCAFFKENHFLVGLSLDGIRETNDIYRHAAGCGSVFERIFGAAKLLQKHGVDFNILTVVTGNTAAHIPEIYEFYRRNGLGYQQYIACLDPLEEPHGQNPYALSPKQYGEFLITLFHLWYKDWKRGRQPYIRQFENYIGILMGYRPEACDQCGICNIQNAVEADGSVYPCDFYMLDQYKLGNLNTDTLAQIDARRKEIGFIEQSCAVDEKCKICKWYQLCRGGCRRDRDYYQDGIGRNYYCAAYERFFEYAWPKLGEVYEEVIRG